MLRLVLGTRLPNTVGLCTLIIERSLPRSAFVITVLTFMPAGREKQKMSQDEFTLRETTFAKLQANSCVQTAGTPGVFVAWSGTMQVAAGRNEKKEAGFLVR